MKKNRKKHHAGRIVSLLAVICLAAALVPMTAFAGEEDVPGCEGEGNSYYYHTYHTKIVMTANVTVLDSDGNTVDTYQVSEAGNYVVGNVSDDAVKAEITRLEATVNSQLPSVAVKSNRTTNLTFDHFESHIDIDLTQGEFIGGEFIGGETSILYVDEYQIYTITENWTVKPMAIPLVDIGNVWKTLDATQPVPFTTELNPNSDCGKQMEIYVQYWTPLSAVTDEDLVNGVITSANENAQYPVAGEDYTYSIILTAKEGYYFPTRDGSYDFDGTLICDGKTLRIISAGTPLVTGEEVLAEVSDDGTCLMITGYPVVTAIDGGSKEYKIIEGANGSWRQNSDGTLTFRANGDFSKFTGVKVDGTLIDAKNYTAVSGSTIITFKTDYLKTLSAGTHSLTVLYTDGECSTNFAIKAAQNENGGSSTPVTAPKTGDNSNQALWLALLAVCGAGVFGTAAYSKRKRYAK